MTNAAGGIDGHFSHSLEGRHVYEEFDWPAELVRCSLDVVDRQSHACIISGGGGGWSR